MSHNTSQALAALAERWAAAKAAERANAQSYVIELCHALGIDAPAPAGSGYEFELAIHVVARDGSETTNYVDCYKRGHFALEAKDKDAGGSDDRLLRGAFGQVRNYVGHLPDQLPPCLMVLDVGKTLLVWDRWSGDYGGFGAARRIDLRTLAGRPDDVDLLRDIWTDPAARDPRARAAEVTRDIAAKLGELAASLESRGHPQEEVARFLIRCVFTMFAEDVDLLPAETFRDLLDDVNTADLPEALEDLWRSMDEGRRFGGRKLARFNGHFFHEVKALPLSGDDHVLLIQAAGRKWADVEPSIFGTLLVRALDPVERHRLGAEFTPREFVERLVRPTIEEPVRERWTLIQAEVLQLREMGRDKDRKAALKAVQEFHEWLCGLQILDPACGSGNFLYVTLHLLKRIELEVLELENELRKSGDADLRLFEVHPRQFHGIEVKPWAREIAELTLWIGYHQFWKQHRHVQYPEPILEDTRTIECRDAVLAWDAIRHDPSRDRPDPTPRIVHPVTGELVPDPAAKLAYMEYVNPRQAEWPRADFIVGNPPYVGNKRMRDALGDGYVEALRRAYAIVGSTADLVMYWWYNSARAVGEHGAAAAGLITTSSIVQAFNRPVVRLAKDMRVGIRWAVRDHPWADEQNGADVRVAMTVIAVQPATATLVTVSDAGVVTAQRTAAAMNDDLTVHADVPSAAAVPLAAMKGLAAQGLIFGNAGFVLDGLEASQILIDDRNATVVRPFIAGRDLSARMRSQYVVDFAMLSEDAARTYSVPFDIVRARVLPERKANKRAVRAQHWWRFVEPNPNLRGLIRGLQRYIATSEVARHRTFQFVDGEIAPGSGLIIVGDCEAYTLGVLSSAIHLGWALAAGGRLGIGNDPRYPRALCFSAFPFPASSPSVRSQIAALAEQLDVHRKAALARGERLTMTGMYNVIEKLRSGDSLTPKDRVIHEIAACGVLKDLHDELDAIVARAYGWPWPMEREGILERLVALHDERVAEEKTGTVRWLRPEYQIPRFAKDVGSGHELTLAAPVTTAAEAALPAWPRTALDQLAAVKALLASRVLSAAEVVAAFEGASAPMVDRHLETLTLMGELMRTADGKYSSPS